MTEEILNDTDVQLLQQLSEQELRSELYRCCSCNQWVDEMIVAKPFQSLDELVSTSNTIWFKLSNNELIKTFNTHPMIGDMETLRKKYKNSNNYESSEQEGSTNADEETLQQLSLLNKSYYSKFNFVFLICATGKTAVEMLRELENRINNDIDTEINNAAIEHSKITKLRLIKLIITIKNRLAPTNSRL